MNESKNLVLVVGEWLEARKATSQPESQSPPSRTRRFLRWLIPNGGTILLALILILTQNV